MNKLLMLVEYCAIGNQTVAGGSSVKIAIVHCQLLSTQKYSIIAHCSLLVLMDDNESSHHLLLLFSCVEDVTCGTASQR